MYCYSKALMYVAGFVVTKSIRFRHVYIATVNSHGPKLKYRIYYITMSLPKVVLLHRFRALR